MSRINVGKVSPIPKGDWDSTTTYEKLNMVNKSGVLYIATTTVPANTAIDNTNYWMQATGKMSIGTIETVSASTGASATITDGTNGPILNLNIPRGESGNETIDDSKGEGDTDYVWSADKTYNEINNIENELDNKAVAIKETVSGAIVSFDDGADQPVKALTVGIEPVQAGSGDPAPDNIRPISGFTGANVFHIGQDLAEGIQYTNNKYYNDLGTIADSTVTKIEEAYIPVVPNAQYVMYLNKDLNSGRVRIHEYASDKTWLRQKVSQLGHIFSWTASSDASYIRYSCQMVADIIRLGEGTLITIDLGGTCYGGMLDVPTGTLTVDRQEFIFNGTETWNEASSNKRVTTTKYIGTILNNSANNSTIDGDISNLYKQITPNGTYNGDEGFSIARDGTIQVADGSGNMNATAFKQSLSSQNLQMVLKLATPIVITGLTPAQMQIILGLNNVWCDTGDTSLTYHADTKLYIQKLTKPTEDDMIANSNIEANKFFMIENSLYYSTTAIAIGTSIIPGDNCTKLSLADALNNLSS